VETVEARTARIEALEHRRSARRGESRDLTKATVPDVFFGGDGYGLPVSPRGAIALADVLACVRRIADTAALLPLHVYRRSESGRERLREGTAELLQRPAPATPQPAFVAQLMGHLALWGEAFVGLYRDEDGEVAQLGLIDPATIQVEQQGGMFFYGIPRDPEQPELTGERTEFDVVTAADVVHVRGLSLDGIRGVSPIRAAREAVSYAKSLSAYGDAFIRQGARPSGVLTVPAGPGQDELIEELKEAFESRHGGPPNAGRVAVLSGEVNFAALTMPLQDAEYIAQRELSSREIARIFSLPPWAIGATTGDSMTYSNVVMQLEALLKFGLAPYLRYVESALSFNLELFPPETYAEFEMDALLRPDTQARSSIYTAGLNPETGWLRREEVRAAENLPEEALTVG
jgi:HK97 family phage portal protein